MSYFVYRNRQLSVNPTILTHSFETRANLAHTSTFKTVNSQYFVSSDIFHLLFDQNVTTLSGQCFYQLRQLHSVYESLSHGIDNDTDPCFCPKPRGLLLQSAHQVTVFSHRQASVCPQCSSPCHNQQQQVQKRVDTASRPSLAGCY